MGDGGVAVGEERTREGGSRLPDDARRALETRWLDLTRNVLPALARPRRWPVRNDHCFQRILLDAATGGVWYDHIAGRPAYAHASVPVLTQAVTLAEAVIGGAADLHALNDQSLAWRRARGPRG